jgi:hypothetical protein
MQAGVAEILEALRANAGPTPGGEWARVAPMEVYDELDRRFHGLLEQTFRNILGQLQDHGDYRRIDDDFGEVKMDGRWTQHLDL